MSSQVQLPGGGRRRTTDDIEMDQEELTFLAAATADAAPPSSSPSTSTTNGGNGRGSGGSAQTAVTTTGIALVGANGDPQEGVPTTPTSVPSKVASTPRQKELGDVILSLRGVEKAYIIDGSDEPVIALRAVNLFNAEANELASLSELTSPPNVAAVGGAAQQSRFLALRRGEFVMIRGPSGGGKTTLLNIIGTLDAPTKGTVELLGNKIDKNSKDADLAEIRLRNIGFVFQTFNLIATMTAAENVELPMTLAGKLSEKERRLRARQLLALVGLRNRVDHLPSELSGGEQQRVTIARALANNPMLLLLDEPTGDLDTATTIDVMNLLVRINHVTKTTCIMVTHNPDLECYADRILYVSDGSFVKEVRNTEPRMLSLDEYVKYLNAREAQLTTQALRREL